MNTINALQDSDLDAVNGGKNTIIQGENGYSIVIQQGDGGKVNGFYVCGPKQCIDMLHPFGY